jgi:hypothetical protein
MCVKKRITRKDLKLTRYEHPVCSMGRRGGGARAAPVSAMGGRAGGRFDVDRVRGHDKMHRDASSCSGAEARILPSGPAPHPGGRERVSICSSARIGRWWSIASRGRDDEGDGGAGGGGGAELDLCSCRRLTALPEWLGELRSLQKCAEVGS